MNGSHDAIFLSRPLVTWNRSSPHLEDRSEPLKFTVTFRQVGQMGQICRSNAGFNSRPSV